MCFSSAKFAIDFGATTSRYSSRQTDLLGSVVGTGGKAAESDPEFAVHARHRYPKEMTAKNPHGHAAPTIYVEM